MDPRPGHFSYKYCIAVALTLGTAWAVRGQFGHEYGAAWAGGIAMMGVIIFSGREDWLLRLPAMTAVSALAWGASGIISYGMVVGYGRSDSFPNVLYGLSMLFLIGSLYGFIGGGLSALALEEKEDRKVNWSGLITQMIAGGILLWFILIYQLGYTMTPPRSELWAASLGAAGALGWFLYRNKYYASLRVALWTMVGTGLGFALGNFLQTLGSISGIDFNWWNVMEYSIGFLGGLGLSYGIAGEKWPEKSVSVTTKLNNGLGIAFLIILLPLINMVEALPAERFLKLGQSLHAGQLDQFVFLHHLTAWGISFLMAGFLILLSVRYWFRSGLFIGWSVRKLSVTIFLLYFVWYILLSNLVGGTWLNGRFTSQHLYWVDLFLIGLLLNGINKTKASPLTGSGQYRPSIFFISISILLAIIVMSFVSVNIHHGLNLPGAQYRF